MRSLQLLLLLSLAAPFIGAQDDSSQTSPDDYDYNERIESYTEEIRDMYAEEFMTSEDIYETTTLIDISSSTASPVGGNDYEEEEGREDMTTVGEEETTVEAMSTTELSTTTEEESGTFGFFSLFGSSGERTSEERPSRLELEKRVTRLSEQVRAVLQSYRQHGVVTLPGAPVPDPMSVPDMRKTIGGSPFHFKDITVHGLSNFTVDHINTDLQKMQVFVALNMKKLVILGNYTLRSWLKKSSGRFNVTLLDVEASGAAEIERDADGNFEATDSEMDMTFMDAKVNFENMGFVGTFIQGIAASIAPAMFDSIKPSILKEVNTRIRSQVNEKMKTIGEKFNSMETVNPIDKTIAAGRRYVKENGYDPYLMEDNVMVQPPVKVNISHFLLTGLSRFYRVGDVSLSMDSGTVQVGIHLATKQLAGSCTWAVDVGKSFSRSGDSKFTVKHLQVRATVNQSLDVQQPPKLDKLDLNVGPVRINMDKSRSFNFLIEFVVNSMPALIRHVIVDTLEIPLKYQVQQILNQVDVEALLNQTLPELDNMGL